MQNNNILKVAPNNVVDNNLFEIETFIKAIWQDGDVRELRLIAKANKKNILSGYFDDYSIMARECYRAQRGNFCYIILNPADPQLLARFAPNTLQRAFEGDTTSDNNIKECRYILIDCDPIRPTNTSSSDEQLADAKILSEIIIEKFGKPYIYGMSGNGYHVIYKIEAGSQTEERKAFLTNLSKETKTPLSKIDTTCFNAGRITKVLGTFAIKGRSTPKYPHRKSKIIEIFQDSEAILIPKIAPKQPPQAKKPAQEKITGQKPEMSHLEKLDFMRNLLQGQYTEEKQLKNGSEFMIACPFNPEHKDAGVTVTENHAFKFHCFHDSCQDRTWEEFRAAIGKEKTYSRVTGTTCKRCGTSDLVWEDHNGKKRLFNRDSILHVCSVRSEPQTESQPIKEEETKTTIEEILHGAKENKAFPINAMPRFLKDFVLAKAKSICTNEEFIYLASLVAASSAMQGSTVHINKDWNSENVSIFGACVGDTGQGKSPAMDSALAPIFDIAKRLQQEYINASEQYKEGLSLYEEQIEDWKKKRISEKPEKPEHPEEKVIVVSNATVEAISRAFKNSPAIILYKDELTGWINSFGQYKTGKGDDKEFFLSGWTGTFVKIIRAGNKDGITLPEKPCLSVLGGIVPENLAKIRQNSDDDGFIERILWVYPEEKERRYCEIETPEKILQEYIGAIERIFYTGKRKIELSQEAKRSFAIYYDYCMDKRNDSKIKGSLAKFPSQAIRIAAIYSAMIGNQNIEIAEMTQAIEMCLWLETQTEKVMGISSVSKEISYAQKIIDWAVRKEKNIVSARDIVIYTRTAKTTAEAKEVMAEMVQLGLCSWHEDGKKIFVDAVDKSQK